jgi:pseudouridine-5'-phosphate glycosidase
VHACVCVIWSVCVCVCVTCAACRGAEESFDISADLQELSRTPVTVVSSGVKSILGVYHHAIRTVCWRHLHLYDVYTIFE